MQPENRSSVRTSHLSRGGRSWVSWQRNEKVWGWEDITAALNIWTTVKQDSVHGPKGRTRTDGVEVTDFSWKQERSVHNFIQVMADGRGGHLGLPSKSLMITSGNTEVTLFRRQLDYLVTQTPSDFLIWEFARNRPITLRATKENTPSGTSIEGGNTLNLKSEKENSCFLPGVPSSKLLSFIYLDKTFWSWGEK